MMLAGSILVGGIVICVSLVMTKPVPVVRSTFNRILEVATWAIQPQLENTPIVGHGTVRPKNQVDIIPQVSGKLTRVHQHLAPGKIIPKGELLFEIDQTVYQARLLQAEAKVRGLEAALSRDDKEMENLKERILNAEQMLEIDYRDYATSKRLFEVEEVGTEHDVDMVHQKYLRQKDATAQLVHRLTDIPHLKLQKQAELDAARAHLTQAQHNLEHTKILCPFKARVEVVHAFTSQVVTAHFSIAKLTDMEAFEISIGIDPRDLRWLNDAVRPDVLANTQLKRNLSVNVSWSMQGQEYRWKGNVTRFEGVDKITRVARMVIEIRDVNMQSTVTHGSVQKGPALSIGMFCTAELPSQPLENALLVPRHSIYDNRWVYIFEANPDSDDDQIGKLARREVPMLRTIGDSVLVDYQGRDGTEICTLAPGEQVIISPLLSPVVGMKIRVRSVKVTSIDHPLEMNRFIDTDDFVDVNTHIPTFAQITIPSVIRDQP